MGEDRWVRPLDVAPGHWKKQLPTATLRIAAKGDVRALRALLAAEPGVVRRRANHGRTLLWEAVRAGKRAAVELLAEAGADLEATGAYNSESHVQLTPRCAAVYYGRSAIAAWLEGRTAPPDVFRAAFLGMRERVRVLLAEDPARLTAEDPHDAIYFVPLVSFALAGGHLDLFRELARRGAKVAPYSGQLLFLAAKSGYLEAVDAALDAGADVARSSAAIVAAASVAVVKRLLSRGADANARWDRDTPLLLHVLRADRAERPEKIEALLAAGADPNARGPDGRSALAAAEAAGRHRIVALLRAHGAAP